MRRRLFNLAAITAAVLFTAICLMWVRSHFARDYGWTWVPWRGDASGPRYLKFDVDSAGGQCELSWKIWTAANREQLKQRNELAGRNFYHRAFDNPRLPSSWDGLGFKHYTGPTHSSFLFPHWSAALLTVILPAVWITHWLLRVTQVKAGHCPTCGYDLRATPGRCPECGAVANERAAATQS